jgi:hypothetical protein
MSDFPISKSPFLNRQIIERDYASGNFEGTKPSEPTVLQPASRAVDPKDLVTPKLPPKRPVESNEPPVQNVATPSQESVADPVQEFQFADTVDANQGFDNLDSGLNAEEEEKMSSQQARDTASMVVLIFNQIVTALGSRFCTIDIESVEANVTNGNIDRHLADAVVLANERSKEKIPLSVEHQKELIRAITVLLRNGNYNGLSPELMAYLSIATVFGVHLIGLVEIAKANKKCVQDAVEQSSKYRNRKEDSNIPEEVVVKAKVTPKASTQKTGNKNNRAKVL